MSRTLFIHAGGSKTGSSALQNFFEINATQLENLGFSYGNKININSEYQISSGNGKLLFKTLSLKTIVDDEIDRLVLSYFENCSNAICSCEYFQELDTHNWKKLYDSSIRININLMVIFYVRNVIPFIQSSYDQGIKRHGTWIPFDEFALKMYWLHVKGLEAIVNGLPLSSIKVIHYDKEKQNLISGFLNILGIDALLEINENDQKRQVNRSLNDKEREALKTVNKVLGGAFSEEFELSDLLVYARPNIHGNPVLCNKETTDFLLGRFNKDVDWVNATFFNGQNVVSVLPIEADQTILNNSSECISERDNDVDTIIFSWAIGKVKTLLDGVQISPRILKTLVAAGQNDSKKNHPDIPDDFYALAYLLLNPDVLYAGADPVQHYIKHGKQEGRPYKFGI